MRAVLLRDVSARVYFLLSYSILRARVLIHSVTFPSTILSAVCCFSSFSSMSASSILGLTGFMMYESAPRFRDSTAFSIEG